MWISTVVAGRRDLIVDELVVLLKRTRYRVQKYNGDINVLISGKHKHRFRDRDRKNSTINLNLTWRSLKKA